MYHAFPVACYRSFCLSPFFSTQPQSKYILKQLVDTFRRSVLVTTTSAPRPVPLPPPAPISPPTISRFRPPQEHPALSIPPLRCPTPPKHLHHPLRVLSDVSLRGHLSQIH